MISCNYVLGDIEITEIEFVSILEEQKTVICNLYSEKKLVASNAGYFYEDKGDNENFKNLPIDITLEEIKVNISEKGKNE